MNLHPLLIACVTISICACSTTRSSPLNHRLKHSGITFDYQPFTAPSDTKIRNSIVGTWIVDNDFARGTVRIFENGTFETQGETKANFPNHSEKVAYEGKWSVRDGILIESITKTNNLRIPAGMVTRDKIVRINHEEFTYQAEDGLRETRCRMK